MPSTFRQTQAGLSLVEMMIATVVGLILIAGVLSIYITSRQGYGTNSAIGQVQENGRFAMGFIRTAAQQAGYMGCGVSNQVVSHLNPVADTLPYDFSAAVTGFEYGGTAPGSTLLLASIEPLPNETPAPAADSSNWAPALVPSLPLTGANYAMPGSDILAVRYVTNSPEYVVAPPSGANATLNSTGTLSAGDIVLVSNCLSGIVMQLTDVTAASSEISAATAGGYPPGNVQAGIPASFFGAQVVKPVTAVFYVSQGLDKQPALFEAVTNPNAASGFTYNELVPGVENMQVLYGIDTNGTHIPTQYVTADNVSNWNDVASVRVALLVRSQPGAVAAPKGAQSYTLLGTRVSVPDDTRLRRVFSADIYLRNENSVAGS